MLETIITSKTRVKLLLKFFLNSNTSGYLRGLESEFQEGSNAIRIELNRFEGAGLLVSEKTGNKKIFKSNRDHPLFQSLNAMVRKYAGIDQIIEEVVEKAGDLESVFLSGKMARGINSQIIELIIIGESVDKVFLLKLVQRLESIIKKKISFVVFSATGFKSFEDKNKDERLLIWNK